MHGWVIGTVQLKAPPTDALALNQNGDKLLSTHLFALELIRVKRPIVVAVL